MKRPSNYKGFQYVCRDAKCEEKLRAYIDWLGDNPTELRDVSPSNYDSWHCDYDFEGVSYLALPQNIKRIGKCVFAQSKIEELRADGVEQIDELAFYNTKELKKVSAKNCKYLLTTDENGQFTDGSDAFNHSCVEVLELSSVERVGRYAFYDMPNISSLDLSSLVDMEPYAVYGTRLQTLNLGNLDHAKTSIVRNNERLSEIRATKLQTMDQKAFDGFYVLSGQKTRQKSNIIMPAGVKISQVEQPEFVLPYNKNVVNNSRIRESFDYEFEYKGFKFNVAEGFDKQWVYDGMKSFIDKCLTVEVKFKQLSYGITASSNRDNDESAEDIFKALKDIYIPDYVKNIGDYAFSKCYGLESVVAPGVTLVGDHAFYCDGGLRYIDLPNCRVLTHDSFNGTAYDYAFAQDDSVQAKIFLENVEFAREHAFWQTGFRVIEMPKARISERDGVIFDENPVLQRLVVSSCESDNVLNNPQLVDVDVKGADQLKIYGSPLLCDGDTAPSIKQ